MAGNNRSRRSRSTGQARKTGGQAQQSQSLASQTQKASRSAFSQFTDTVREHPKTAIAAGAAMAAGATAAAVYGIRGRGNSGE